MDRIHMVKQTAQTLYGEVHEPRNGMAGDFFAIKERFLYGEVYQHVKLDGKLREFLILAVATTNQTMHEVSLHTRAALQEGAAPEEIMEAVCHCAPYIGMGQAEAALQSVSEALTAWGAVLPVESRCTVTEEDRLERGIAAQKAIFGDLIDAMRAAAPDNQKHLQKYLSAWCFGDFYTRTGLDLKQRELLTFCILCALGGCENQVKAHIGGNAAVGNDKNVLLDALTVCLPYIGFPRTLNALSCLNEVLPEQEKQG